MEAPLWILLVYSSVGTVDGIYNHLYRYRLYAHASSFTEHISHTFLSLGLALIVTLLVFVEMGNVGFTFLLGVQALSVRSNRFPARRWRRPAVCRSVG